MESLKQALFEDPLYLYVCLVFAELVLVAVWHERRTRRWAMALLAGPLLAGAVFLMERAVVTDREQIVLTIRQIARDTESGGLKELRVHLDDDFTSDFGTKDKAIRAAEKAVRNYKVKSVSVGKPNVEVSGDRAAMRLATVIQFSGSGVSGHSSLLWDLEWVKRGDAWRILRATGPRQGLPMP